MNDRFSHLDDQNNPAMVDVGQKSETQRTAVAQARIRLPEEVVKQFAGHEISTKKGPVFQTAILAGIMGAKKTSELIPLCHPLALDKCSVKIDMDDDQVVVITCTARITGKTGVEMEALTGASVAALTVYDMCKAFSHNIVIEDIRLMAKSGGKRDFQR